MRKSILSVLFLVVLAALVACAPNEGADEFVIVEVDFTVPEKAAVGEAVELHAVVTYGDENVTDARVVFEIWNSEDTEREHSVSFDAENHGDGSYTLEYTFEEAGSYEMYAHTDAHDMHTMPKKQIIVE